MASLSRLRQAVLVPVGCLLLVACAGERLRNERLIRFVDEITFGGPLDEHLAKDGRVAKWAGQLRFTTTGIGAGEYRPRVSDRVAILGRLIGLDATMTEAGEDANVTVSFVPSPDFLVNREHVPCYAHVVTAAGRIVRAEIQVSVARSETIDRCLDHELLHALGLRYHSGRVRSVLSPAHEEKTLTPWDEMALRVLYDERLEAGTTSEFALPIFREIIGGMSEQR